ncbi:hypothetical protein PROFUN_00402 [Planoprotostelium fungivorum]|uniref:Uncharacterized protein n=1 Tax=Planoprotostelium fungivorum TaxID=1890364 RepID=A0A2P6NY98_9EUKA|nr:hypothetical protein PROFUN_00402 [Planoprotostelium fungivorum]
MAKLVPLHLEYQVLTPIPYKLLVQTVEPELFAVANFRNMFYMWTIKAEGLKSSSEVKESGKKIELTFFMDGCPKATEIIELSQAIEPLGRPVLYNFDVFGRQYEVLAFRYVNLIENRRESARPALPIPSRAPPPKSESAKPTDPKPAQQQSPQTGGFLVNCETPPVSSFGLTAKMLVAQNIRRNNMSKSYDVQHVNVCHTCRSPLDKANTPSKRCSVCPNGICKKCFGSVDADLVVPSVRRKTHHKGDETDSDYEDEEHSKSNGGNAKQPAEMNIQFH